MFILEQIKLLNYLTVKVFYSAFLVFAQR